MLNELAGMMDYIESIGVANIGRGSVTVTGEICYYYIPIGIISDDFYKDIEYNYNNVYLINYIKPIPYYCYTIPIPFNLFKTKINLNEVLIKYLKKFVLNIYEIDIKTKKLNQNYREMERLSTHKVKIPVPTTIQTGLYNWVMCSAYQPDKVYLLCSDGLYKEE